MPRGSEPGLSRREREIMEIIYRLEAATAAEVREAMPDPPSYSAVRTFLRLLEEKGHLRHREDGRRYVFLPKVPAARARKSALRGLLHTFFGGSAEAAVASLIEDESLSDEELARLSGLIDRARRKEEGRS
jgi:predicted transcriptional regulator